MPSGETNYKSNKRTFSYAAMVQEHSQQILMTKKSICGQLLTIFSHFFLKIIFAKKSGPAMQRPTLPCNVLHCPPNTIPQIRKKLIHKLQENIQTVVGKQGQTLIQRSLTPKVRGPITAINGDMLQNYFTKSSTVTIAKPGLHLKYLAEKIS